MALAVIGVDEHYWRHTRERPAEVTRRQVRSAGERFDVQGLRVVAVDPVAHPAHPGELRATGGIVVSHGSRVSGDARRGGGMLRLVIHLSRRP